MRTAKSNAQMYRAQATRALLRATLFALVFIGNSVVAQESPAPFEKVLSLALSTDARSALQPRTQIDVWFRGKASEAPSSLKEWADTLPPIARHPVFREHFPKRVAILVDPTWTSSSGFHSRGLAAPDGTPAVLISAQAVSGGTQADAQLLAHELTHLVQDRLRPHEASWVREGTALLAEYRITGFRDPSALEALEVPETSLVADLSVVPGSGKRPELSQYGHIAQYFEYIHRLCGGDSLLEALLSSSELNSGIAFVDRFLKSSGSAEPACQSFDESFRRFERARFIASPYSADGYVFRTPRRARLQSGPHFDLPPYSAGAYIMSVGDLDGAKLRCPPGEESWGQDKCIRIRAQ